MICPECGSNRIEEGETTQYICLDCGHEFDQDLISYPQFSTRE